MYLDSYVALNTIGNITNKYSLVRFANIENIKNVKVLYSLIWRFMHRASSYNMYMKIHKILVIRLYFLLDALHV